MGAARVAMVVLVATAGLAACSIPAKTFTRDDGLPPWGPPTPLSITIAGSDDDPTLTGDMQELYFHRNSDLYVSLWTASAWSAPMVVVPISTPTYDESTPQISYDGLTLYYSSDQPLVGSGSGANENVWVTTRATRNDPWTAGVPVGQLNMPPANSRGAAPSYDGTQLVMDSDRTASNYNLYITTGSAATRTWSAPVLITNPDGAGKNSAPFLSMDAKTLYFHSDRNGNDELFEATRSDAVSGVFGSAVPLTELNADVDDKDPWVSSDSLHMVFTRAYTLYETAR